MSVFVFATTSDKKGNGRFSLKDGTKIIANTENFIQAVKINKLDENSEWGISSNYSIINIGDSVYLLGCGERIMIGYGVVINKNDDQKNVMLKLDLLKSRLLLRTNISFSLLEKYVIKPAIETSAMRTLSGFENIIEKEIFKCFRSK